MKRGENTIVLLYGFTYTLYSATGEKLLVTEDKAKVIEEAKKYHKSINRTGEIHLRMVGQVNQYEHEQKFGKTEPTHTTKRRWEKHNVTVPQWALGATNKWRTIASIPSEVPDGAIYDVLFELSVNIAENMTEEETQKFIPLIRKALGL